MRTITLDFTRSEMLSRMDFSDLPHPSHAAAEYLAKLDKILAYLFMWGETCERVVIWADRTGDMTAAYYKTQDLNERAYFVMGAIWRGELFEYTTHS